MSHLQTTPQVRLLIFLTSSTIVSLRVKQNSLFPGTGCAVEVKRTVAQVVLWLIFWSLFGGFCVFYWVPAVIQFFVCLCFFWWDFCSRVLFSVSPDFVHGLFLVILQQIWIGWPANWSSFFSRSRFFFVLVQIFYVFPCRVNPVQDNWMMTKASSRARPPAWWCPKLEASKDYLN
jgi:hypothetical protein